MALKVGWLVYPPLWSRPKYLNNYCINFMELGTNIQDAQRMNLNDFGDPLAFLLEPQRGLWFRVKYLYSYQIDCHETCGHSWSLVN